MILKSRLFHSVVAYAALALLTCTSQENPFKPQDARINLVVENSSHHIDTLTVTDTVGNRVRIGMSAYLPLLHQPCDGHRYQWNHRNGHDHYL